MYEKILVNIYIMEEFKNAKRDSFEEFKPWKKSEIVKECVVDDFEHKQAFIRLPLPFDVKERIIEQMVKGGVLEDAIIEEKTKEQIEKDLLEKYIDPSLNDSFEDLQEIPGPPALERERTTACEISD